MQHTLVFGFTSYKPSTLGQMDFTHRSDAQIVYSVYRVGKSSRTVSGCCLHGPSVPLVPLKLFLDLTPGLTPHLADLSPDSGMV
jgi:hypothetical protein